MGIDVYTEIGRKRNSYPSRKPVISFLLHRTAEEDPVLRKEIPIRRTIGITDIAENIILRNRIAGEISIQDKMVTVRTHLCMIMIHQNRLRIFQMLVDENLALKI